MNIDDKQLNWKRNNIMTQDQAKELVKRYFEVKAIAGDRPFNIPVTVDEAKELLGQEEVAKIEQEVNAAQN